jgi:ABC-type phosphate transport system auxiliary subunit
LARANVEIGVSKEPDNLVLELLRNIRADIAQVDEKIDVKVDGAKSELRSEMNELRSEMNSLRADVAADFLSLRKESGEQIAGLRRAVVEYHSAVLGHGVLISDLEARVRRMEQHLGLSATGVG